MKVLLTGAAGFIGSHLAETLLERGDEVCAVDNFNDYYSPARKEKNIQNALRQRNYTLHKADIRDFEAMQRIFEKERPDKICHLAAMANPRYSVQNPFIYEEVNVRGTLNLLELARLFGTNHFVFASSSSVYGRNSVAPFKEIERADEPLSPYAASKRSAEHIAFTYHHLYGLKITGLRFFTAFGPRNRPDMGVYMFTRAIDKGEPLKLFGDGSMRRDWTYIGDTVRGIIAALDRPFDFEIINLGNNKPQAIRDLLEAAEQALAKKANIITLPIPATEPPVTCADTTKARDLLGFEATTPFRDGYNLFFEWYVKEGRD